MVWAGWTAAAALATWVGTGSPATVGATPPEPPGDAARSPAAEDASAAAAQRKGRILLYTGLGTAGAGLGLFGISALPALNPQATESENLPGIEILTAQTSRASRALRITGAATALGVGLPLAVTGAIYADRARRLQRRRLDSHGHVSPHTQFVRRVAGATTIIAAPILVISGVTVGRRCSTLGCAITGIGMLGASAIAVGVGSGLMRASKRQELQGGVARRQRNVAIGFGLSGVAAITGGVFLVRGGELVPVVTGFALVPVGLTLSGASLGLAVPLGIDRRRLRWAPTPSGIAISGVF